jgi:hypothetical protein
MGLAWYNCGMARHGYRSVTLADDVYSQLTELASIVTERDKRKVGVSGVISKLVQLYGQSLKAELVHEQDKIDTFSFLERQDA